MSLCGVVWCGVLKCGEVWCSVVWCGVVIAIVVDNLWYKYVCCSACMRHCIDCAVLQLTEMQ